MTVPSMFYEAFRIKQLVLVNCAAYCYTKIRLDQHTALLGTNNQGKTSMLNALKFFLLPEENLNGCEDKFGFRNSKGLYDKSASYDWYFPESSSFMILEAENPHGPFCIVLNRSNRPFGYERQGVPVTYDQIEHLFWDKTSPVNNGMGAPVEHLSPLNVTPSLKKLGAVLMRDVATIKERIYKHQSTRTVEGRFCLLPLKGGGAQPREIEAWKSLIRLAFDIGAKDQRTLPNTIATIIEGNKDRPEAELKVRFRDILERYDVLRVESDRLLTVQNATPKWTQFDAGYRSLVASIQGLIGTLVGADRSIEEERASIQRQRDTAAAAFTEANRNFIGVREEERSKNRDREQLSGQIIEQTKEHNVAQQDSFRLSELRREYSGMELDEATLILEEFIEQRQARIDSLQDAVTKAETFANAQRQDRIDGAREDQIRASLEQSLHSVLEQLDGFSADILYTLNSRAFTAVSGPLSSEHHRVIREFTGLFSSRDGALVFLDQQIPVELLPFDALQARQNLESDLQDLRRRREGNRRLMKDLAEYSSKSKEQVESSVKELKTEIAQTRDDIDLLRRREHVERTYEEKTRRLNESKALLEEFEEALRGFRDKVQTLENTRDGFQSDIDRLKNRDLQIASWQRSVKDSLQLDLAYLRPDNVKFESQYLVVTDETIKAIHSRKRQLNDSFDKVREPLVYLLEQELLTGDDAEAAHFATINIDAMARFHELFAVIFGRLETEQENHRNSVQSHNHDTSIQIKSIQHAKTLITNFISKLEDHLCDVQVSNLEAVKIDCKLHPQFEELLISFDQINLMSSGLHSHVLYERIGSFCGQFFEKDARRDSVLNMERLIENIDYMVKKKGDDRFTQIAQSTGTSVMINCRLLAFLLKELLQPDTKINLPLFIDELSNLDDQNLKTAREIADSDGFFVFGATPTLTGAISKVLGNYVNLSYFTAFEESYNPKRPVLFTGLNEFLLSKGRNVTLPANLVEVD